MATILSPTYFAFRVDLPAKNEYKDRSNTLRLRLVGPLVSGESAIFDYENGTV